MRRKVKRIRPEDRLPIMHVDRLRAITKFSNPDMTRLFQYGVYGQAGRLFASDGHKMVVAMGDSTIAEPFFIPADSLKHGVKVDTTNDTQGLAEVCKLEKVQSTNLKSLLDIAAQSYKNKQEPIHCNTRYLRDLLDFAITEKWKAVRLFVSKCESTDTITIEPYKQDEQPTSGVRVFALMAGMRSEFGVGCSPDSFTVPAIEPAAPEGPPPVPPRPTADSEMVTKGTVAILLEGLKAEFEYVEAQEKIIRERLESRIAQGKFDGFLLADSIDNAAGWLPRATFRHTQILQNAEQVAQRALDEVIAVWVDANKITLRFKLKTRVQWENSVIGTQVGYVVGLDETHARYAIKCGKEIFSVDAENVSRYKKTPAAK